MSIDEIPTTDDTISNFGKFLPAPYIERVEIYDEKVRVFISIFLLTDLNGDTDTTLQYLSDKLYFYIMHARDGSYEAVDTDTEFGLDNADWDSVIDGKMNVLAAYDEATQNAIIEANGFLDLSETDPLVVMVYSAEDSEFFNDTEWTITEDLYDDNGNPIIKAQIEIDYRPEDVLDFTSLDFWNVFAFASIYEYDASDIETMLENPALLDLRVSDVSYERVFKDGELQHKIVSFVDVDDLVYSDVPIQSITDPYYKTDNITRDDMIEYFEELVTGFKETDVYDPKDTELNNMLNSISSVVEEYGESTQFLKEMDLRRAYFTSKDPAEPVGKLYVRFRKRIYTANRALENGTQVKKVLNRNPKIVDLRSGEVLTYVSPEYDDDLSDTYIYSESFMSRNSFGYSYLSYTGYTVNPDGSFSFGEIFEDVVARNRGYFFFDYEKAFRQTAIINSILDISKLSLLGVEATPYDAFKITEASITRTEGYMDTDTGTNVSHDIVISCEFNEDTNYPLTETVTVNNESSMDDTYALPNPGGLSEFTAETFPEGETDYLILRNFVPRQTDSISSTYPDYRLACFEFQDFYDYDVACGGALAILPTEYSVKVTIEDRTIEVARALITYYEGVQAELEIYYDAAADDLSSNDAGDFNNFFSEGANTAFLGLGHLAPWIVAPAVYCIFKDIIYNTYGGDIDKISAEAQKIIDGIDPYTGNLFVLETFWTTFDDFYTNVLSDSGEIGSLVDDAGIDALTLEFDGTVPYDSSSSEAGCDGIYAIVEEVVEEVVEEDGDDEDESIDWDTSPTEIDYDVNSTGVIGIDAIDIEQILNEWEDTFGYTAFPEDGGDHDTARENIKDEIEAHLTAAAGGHLSDWATDINYNENTTIYTNADGDIYKYKVRMNTHTWYVNIQERTPV